MKDRKFTYFATVSIGGMEATEFDVKAEYTVAWGSPEVGRFGPVEGYDPGSDSAVENIRILEIDGRTEGWSKDFTGGYLTDEKVADIIADTLEADHSEHMIAEAGEKLAGETEHAAEQRAEMRREGF